MVFFKKLILNVLFKKEIHLIRSKMHEYRDSATNSEIIKAYQYTVEQRREYLDISIGFGMCLEILKCR